MTIFQIIALLLTLTALFSYLNYRFLKLPSTIGVMLITLLISLAVIGLQQIGIDIKTSAERIFSQVDFGQALMQGMLSFLLFAGALHIDISGMKQEKFAILMLATGGVILSTFLAGTGIYYALHLLGFQTSYAFCLLFGAIVSPTDPIAVLAILKSVQVPKSLEARIAGESLFNDGIGVIAFLILGEIALGGGTVSAAHIGKLFLEEAIGGAAFGFVIGGAAFLMLKSVDNYRVEIMITLALVSGGYALALALHLSGPIAIVVAGLLVGHHGRRFAMSNHTREQLDAFWELIDDILNTVLFVLIGLEILLLTFTGTLFKAGLIASPVLLLARWLSVLLPISLMRLWREFKPGAITLMTWGGLRGGISVALALSLPANPERDLIVTMTYILVIFSIVVQGLTIKPVIKRFVPEV